MTNSDKDSWEYKEEWKRRGRDFLVSVTRHSVLSDGWDGPNRWCVYAYIYPKHPYFSAFNGPHMWQDAACALPLHAGPSLLEYPMYEGKVTSVKVGADYHHLHDDHFTHYATKEEAYEVFSDASELFEWLSERASVPAESEVSMSLTDRPVAIHQFRSPHCSDWYDGVPDHHDGHGPYEVRTLYTSPQRTWEGLTDYERCLLRKEVGYNQFMTAGEYAELVQKATEAALKVKNCPK